ncbi:MAG: hypothetical protein NTU80_04970 [Verrucomicrobia bacterium]|nr:hypothetical protein [Verrucomicrobiota bacterium]
MHVLLSILATTLLILLVTIWGISILSFYPKLIRSSFSCAAAVGAGIGILVLIGLIIVISPAPKVISAYISLITVTIASVYFIRRNRKILVSDWPKYFIKPIVLWICASVIATSLTYIQPQKPKELFDGPYVFKTWTLPVKIQALCNDFPADNAIPAVVTEFLVRQIPFDKERPIMPGQEISNRPILLSLAAVPFRTLLGDSPKYSEPLPRFQYVGQQWPQTLQLTDNAHFREFLFTGIALNASLIIALYSLLKLNEIKNASIVCVIFFLLSPYALQHTFFTWPKNLAAFFILIAAIIVVYRNFPLWTAGVFTGLAYWSHPYTLVFIISISFVLLVSMRVNREPIIKSATFFIALTVIMAIWPIWTHLCLNIPSDLIQQNFNLNGNLFKQLWVRIYNAQTLLFPNFLNLNPFNGENIIRSYFINLAAPLGLCLMIFTPAALLDFKNIFRKVLGLFAVTSGIMVIAIFSEPAVPLLHGWQAIWPVLVVLTLAYLQGKSLRATKLVLVAQAILNISFLMLWIVNVAV